MNKNLIVVLTVAVVIAIAGSYYFPKVQQTVNQVLGAVPTLDGVDSGFTRINSQKTFYFGGGLTATSSFLCTFKNPYGATTSIEHIGMEVVNRGTMAEANALYISTSTTAFGTSTPALVSAFAMGTGQFDVVMGKNASTTVADTTLLPGITMKGTSNYLLAPSEWITWKVATTTGGTYITYPTGSCSVILRRP